MLLEPTAEGLWCEAGGFHVDPWRPVPLAVVTHAHADQELQPAQLEANASV